MLGGVAETSVGRAGHCASDGGNADLKWTWFTEI